MDTIYDRIKALCQRRGISISALESTLGFGKSSIKKWQGSVSPSMDNLLKVAMFFNVSLDYLVGRTTNEETSDDLMGDASFVSLKRAMMSVPPEKRRNAVVMIEAAFADAYGDNDGSVS